MNEKFNESFCGWHIKNKSHDKVIRKYIMIKFRSKNNRTNRL